MLQEAVSAIGSGKAQTVSNVYLIANDQTCYPLHTTAFLSSAIDLSFLKEVCGQPFSRTGGIVYDIEYNAYIPIGMEYRNYYTGESIGYLVMLLPERSMRGLFSGLLTTEGTTFLADTDGEIFENSAGSPPNLSSISYSTDIADTEQSSIKIAKMCIRDRSQTEMDMSPNQRAVKYSRTLLLKEPKMHRLRLPSRKAS